jgi:hypothetical protein
MKPDIFSASDVHQIENHDLTVKEVLRQIEFFTRPPAYLKLHRPCTPGDGIRVLDDAEVRSFSRLFDREKDSYDLLKFVPASGAATRMFKVPLQFFNMEKPWSLDSIAEEALSGNPEARAILDFFEGFSNFAFHSDLEVAIHSSGTTLKNLLDQGDLRQILAFLLTDKGLQYGFLPKALIKFHRYNGERRTAFEEHLVEAPSYAVNSNKVCRLHLTVSEEHRNRFSSLLEDVRPLYEARFRVSYEIGFSLQKKRTDTIAVDLRNHPFRLEKGRLLFRPGGHGALIENLGDLNADMIFIKNVDNVVPDRLKEATSQWKKILGGLFIHLQSLSFRYIEQLSQGIPSEQLLDEIRTFAAEELNMALPDELRKEPLEKQQTFLLKKLDRPLRVCGMVRNVGEPGGGPFWVEDNNGDCSCQIVEMNQIDLQSEGQKQIVSSSTHFNPVDLVCGIKDSKGRPFALNRFVDHEAVFISQKSKDGKDLKALELPGLWNGAMAYWNTVFADVPLITFNPVKTVNDLLRKEHQPL